MKVREVISVAKWVSGSGWDRDNVVSNKVIDVFNAENPDDDTWEDIAEDLTERENGVDYVVTISYYEPSDIPEHELSSPIAEYERWASEIFGN